MISRERVWTSAEPSGKVQLPFSLIADFFLAGDGEEAVGSRAIVPAFGGGGVGDDAGGGLCDSRCWRRGRFR